METKNKKNYLIQHLREKCMWFRRVYWRLPKKFIHHGPSKQKYVRVNNLAFINKTHLKVIMQIWHL